MEKRSSNRGRFRCGVRGVLAVFLLACCCHGWAVARVADDGVTIAPIPEEVRSAHFRVTVNGRSSEVLHAATGYYLLNFETDGAATVSVTAEDPHYWDRGVEVQPMRLGIRPVRRGATITFPIAGPEKLTIARPGDHFADAEMLFLFANPPDRSGITATTPGVRYFGPGAHRENIDAQSGDKIYLAPGAVIFGALNVWQVHDVRVFGTGTILYDGPQNPLHDEGWMHKKNWHVIVMDDAKNIEIDGITCIVRSRTWQIQMKDSHGIGFYNVKVIGGNPHNANQDGMDWLGGGDTTVSNSFFRASDDVFALQGNWDGYDLALLRVPGHNVENITIENTIASTSISNTVRVNWPQKTFNSAHFHMRDVDVIHTGFGGCKVPFAFFELWADPDGKGSHTDYRFDDIRLEDWYSLFQLRQPLPSVRDISFSHVWAMDGAAMVPPVAQGEVSGVTVRDTSLEGFEGAETVVEQGAAAIQKETAKADAPFGYSAGMLRAREPITFTAASEDAEGRRFEWIFGDGKRGSGRAVRHAFADAEGTLLDGSGRFRVLLHVIDKDGEQRWESESVVLAGSSGAKATTGMATAEVPSGAMVFERMLHVPAEGGYTVTLLTSVKGTLAIDDLPPAMTPKPQAQVCGAKGDAVQPVRVSAALTAGDHRIRVVREPGIENASALPGAAEREPLLLWEGPGLARQAIPAGAMAVAGR